LNSSDLNFSSIYKSSDNNVFIIEFKIDIYDQKISEIRFIEFNENLKLAIIEGLKKTKNLKKVYF
jgi:hypothetical protein